MSDQLDRIEQATNNNSTAISEIRTLLAGDKYGNEGMVKKQQRNHSRINKLEKSHQKITWLGGIGTFFLGILIAFKDEIKNLFQ